MKKNKEYIYEELRNVIKRYLEDGAMDISTVGEGYIMGSCNENSTINPTLNAKKLKQEIFDYLIDNTGLENIRRYVRLVLYKDRIIFMLKREVE